MSTMTMYMILAAVAMPILASVYAMVRRPKWSGDFTGALSWRNVNIISAIAGMVAGAIPVIVFSIKGGIDTVSAVCFTECVSVIGWCAVSCSITDFSHRVIDRHMMRAMYVIQFAVGCLYYWNSFASHSLAVRYMLALLAVMLVVLSTGYIKFLQFGASDSRCLAVMMAATMPFLGQNVIWPFLIAIAAIYVTGIIVYVVALNHHRASYQYKSGSILESVDARKGPDSKWALDKGSRLLSKQKTPAGHAMTIPYLIYMLIWLL